MYHGVMCGTAHFALGCLVTWYQAVVTHLVCCEMGETLLNVHGIPLTAGIKWMLLWLAQRAFPFMYIRRMEMMCGRQPCAACRRMALVSSLVFCPAFSQALLLKAWQVLWKVQQGFQCVRR